MGMVTEYPLRDPHGSAPGGKNTFRRVMDGMARPGALQNVDGDCGAPPPLSIAAGAIALSLAAHGEPVWLSASLHKSAVPGWLLLNTGVALTPEKAEARFAFLEAGAALPSLGLFSAGRQDGPEGAALLVIDIDGFDSDRALKLTGPGLAGGQAVHPRGLPDGFSRQWAENHALFPRGVDAVLTAGTHFLCLPRTTRLTQTSDNYSE